MTSQQGWNKTNWKVIYQPTSLPSFVTFDSFYFVLCLKLSVLRGAGGKTLATDHRALTPIHGPRWLQITRSCTNLTFERIHKFIPHRGKRAGGLDGIPPRVFDMLQYFETILPLVESLWSSLRDEVYFIGGGAAGGLWRHQQWSPSWILPRIGNQFLCLTWKITRK